MRKALIVTIFGSVLASLGDFIHVVTGTTGYPADYAFYLGPLPFWVPFLFAAASLSTFFAQQCFEPFLTSLVTHWFKRISILREKPRLLTPAKAYSLAALGFIIIYGLSGFLGGAAGGSKDFVLAVLALSFFGVMDGTGAGLCLAVATGVAGTAFEYYLVSQGVFWYAAPSANLHGVPTWLPWLYVGASTAIMTMRHSLPAIRQMEK